MTPEGVLGVPKGLGQSFEIEGPHLSMEGTITLVWEITIDIKHLKSISCLYDHNSSKLLPFAREIAKYKIEAQNWSDDMWVIFLGLI